MKPLFAFLVLGIVFLSGSRAAFAEKVVTKEAALKAIATFEKDPASKEGFAAAAVFMNFAEHSDKVRISLSHSVVPWLKDKDASDADTRKMLLGAYVAGNLEAQLKSGQRADNVYAGWQQVLLTYAQLLRINSAAKISEVEDLKKREVAGTLRAYAAEVQK